ncbi:head maturation protease, ClpP-related [Brachybacterium squillarum]|uniref:head maturation protease, ClpP-related n=1 Tax=Brachybacterium squillarum TaxID=661979 RepID=UPI0022233363|nr:head maturation protease, ClpP-related [Brachybacterium squillarum]MCW1803867.1 ATP-dependent Clp protease proteolytic subunit [Brachybacterium squillarum]
MGRTLRDRFNFATNKQKTPVHAAIPGSSGDESKAVLRIYDPIDSWGEWFGLSAKEFGQALDALPPSVEEIELHVNSPGGEVHEGLAILNQLRQHKASVTVVIDGLAASAASFIAMGADRVLISPNAEVMIHNAWMLAMGDSGDMRKAADDLERLNTNLARIYQGKAGGDVEDWLEAMRVESWYSDEEAVAAGLADAILSADEPEEPAAEARFNLGVFAHAGRADAPSPYIPRAAAAAAGPRPAEQSVTPTHEGDDDMSNLIKGLRNRIGIADDAELTDDQLLAAVDEALAERAEETPAAATRALPEGSEIVDSEVLARLQSEAEDGRTARAEQAAARREKAVDDAIKAGKFGPARRESWLNRLERDEEGGLADLEALTPGLVPMSQVGDAGEELDADEAAYARVYGNTQKKEA